MDYEKRAAAVAEEEWYAEAGRERDGASWGTFAKEGRKGGQKELDSRVAVD